jgi:hypothetical protein
LFEEIAITKSVLTSSISRTEDGKKSENEVLDDVLLGKADCVSNVNARAASRDSRRFSVAERKSGHFELWETSWKQPVMSVP